MGFGPFAELPPEEEQRMREVSRMQAASLHGYLAQVLIGVPGSGTDSPVNSGSAILVRLQSGVAVLTANHVISQYESLHALDGRVRLQVGDVALEIAQRQTYRDEHADLALIAVSEGEAGRIGTVIHDPPVWPPPVPAVDSYVWLVGFPEALRQRTGENDFRFASMVSCHRVKSSFLGHFTVEIERDSMDIPRGSALSEPGMNFGGMSGGPVFLMADLHSPLVGIIKEDWPGAEYFIVQGLTGLPRRLV
jgi:hypothetical protein